MVLYTLIISSDISFFPTKKLQHQHNQQHLSINLTILSLNYPPYFFILRVENLPHELFVLIKGEFSTGGKVGGQVDQLGGGVLSGGK